MQFSRLSLVALVVAFALTGSPAASAGVFSGKLVSLSSSRAVVESSSGVNKTFRLSTLTRFTLDNKTTRPSKIEPGVRVSVFTSSRGKVTKIVARSGQSTGS